MNVERIVAVFLFVLHLQLLGFPAAAQAAGADKATPWTLVFHWTAVNPRGTGTVHGELELMLKRNQSNVYKEGDIFETANPGIPGQGIFFVKGSVRNGKFTFVLGQKEFFLDAGGQKIPFNFFTTKREITLPVEDGAEKVVVNPQPMDTIVTSTWRLVGNQETQHWQAHLKGYEIDEMNPYWETTTKARGALQFDYDVQAEFTIVDKLGVWEYKEGKYTRSDIKITSLYGPPDTWEHILGKCGNCNAIKQLTGSGLSATLNGDTIWLHWTKLVPSVNVEAHIIADCKPMPNCKNWGTRYYEGKQFFSRAATFPMTLQNQTVPYDVFDSEDIRWIHFNYSLKRLK